MIFVTGPLFSGKRECIRKLYGLTEEEFAVHAVWNVQELVADEEPEYLAERLAEKEFVIATEIGGGLVPMDPAERHRREAAGRLACLLAERADTVIRVCCGLPQILKGDQP